MCLYTERNYTRIYLSDKTYYLVRSSLSRALKKLPPEMFIKIHQSLVAFIYFIDDIAINSIRGAASPKGWVG